MIGFFVLGVVNGLVIAVLALGFVLVYKAGRFLNLAHAQLGVVPALLLAKLVLDLGLPWLPAFVVALAVGGLIGYVSERLVVRPLADRSRATLLIASIGLSQVLLAFTYFTWLGPSRLRLNAEGYPVPFETSIPVGALTLRGQHVVVLVLVPAVAAGLSALFRWTLLGKAIRAAACNRDAAALAGVSVSRVSSITWVVAGVLAAVSAVLTAPGQAVFDTQALGPSLLLRVLGAAAVARFTNMPVAFAAGVALGVLESLVVFVTHSDHTATAVMFLVILVSLLVRYRDGSESGTATEGVLDPHDKPIAPPPILAGALVTRVRVLAVGIGLFLGVLAPYLPRLRTPSATQVLTLTLCFALVALSLTLLAGWGGQVSLGQFAFLGLGALVAARLQEAEVGLPAVLALTALAGAAAGAIIGIPAMRVAGLGLAVTTLGLAVVGPAWLFRQPWLAGGEVVTAGALHMPGIGDLDTARSTYYATFVVVALAAFGLAALRRSSPGRLVVAVRDNAPAAAALGTSPGAVRLSVFMLAAALAAVAGALWLATVRNVSVTVFDPQQSFVMLSLAVVGGISSVAGAFLGAVALYGIPELTHDFMHGVLPSTVQMQLLLGGSGLIVMQLTNPGGLAAVTRQSWQRLLDRVAADRAAAPRPEPSDAVLEVDDVHLSFGGVRALQGVSLRVRPGEIVGLIGANGAGKTTLLNVVSGRLTPSSGSVLLDGSEVAHLPPDARAHLGIGRSFQDARLFPGLTVRETIQVALARRRRVGLLAGFFGAPWSRFTERQTRRRADELVAGFGLATWADTAVGDLSTGTRRICDLVTQVAAEPRVLLLDEPTAGVAQRDAEAFAPLIRRIADELGCAVVIVEHDMPLMLRIADRLYYLEAGRLAAEGTPHEIRHNPIVIAGYLGTTEAAIARSGPTTPRASRRRRAAVASGTT